MKRFYRKMAMTSLFLVYLVITAGAVVRMTGSGMGCPDWPKCFGYYIPPVERAELEWQPAKEYKKGQVIILDESLWVANGDFTSANEYNANQWSKYTRHDYAAFNVFHTWTEFINRLLGALAGLAVLVTAFISLSYWTEDKLLVILSWVTLFAIGFQGWLGATVVYSVLEPVKITMHMIMALVIVALLLYLIFRSKAEHQPGKYHPLTKGLVAAALIMSVVQIILGTQVRQFVDIKAGILGEQFRNLWLAEPDLSFYTHRSFSIVVLLLNLYLAFIIYKNRLGLPKINWVLVLILAEVCTGMAMYYLDFPFGTQSAHLIMAAVLFGLQFYLLLESGQTVKSL
ncbi:MAG: COX15/CtaA family protein [Flavobacteriaceae bacterium]